MTRLVLAVLLFAIAAQAQQPIGLTAVPPFISPIKNGTDGVTLAAQVSGAGAFSFSIKDGAYEASGDIRINPPASLNATDNGTSLTYPGRAQFSGQATFTDNGKRAGPFWQSINSQDQCDSNPLKTGSFSCQITDLQIDDSSGQRLAYFTGEIFFYDSSLDTQYTIVVRMQYALGAAPAKLDIDHIETVQVIQDAKNSVDLVAGKSTAVRVFLKSTGPNAQDITSGITGTLTSDEFPDVRHPMNKDAIAPAAAPDENNPRHSLNFILPSTWTNPPNGALHLHATAKSETVRRCKRTLTNLSQASKPCPGGLTRFVCAGSRYARPTKLAKSNARMFRRMSRPQN
jgi:hypothetical protein